MQYITPCFCPFSLKHFHSVIIHITATSPSHYYQALHAKSTIVQQSYNSRQHDRHCVYQNNLPGQLPLRCNQILGHPAPTTTSFPLRRNPRQQYCQMQLLNLHSQRLSTRLPFTRRRALSLRRGEHGKLPLCNKGGTSQVLPEMWERAVDWYRWIGYWGSERQDYYQCESLGLSVWMDKCWIDLGTDPDVSGHWGHLRPVKVSIVGWEENGYAV